MKFNNIKELESTFKLFKFKKNATLSIECYRAYNSKDERYIMRAKYNIPSYYYEGLQSSKWFTLNESYAIRHVESMKKGETKSTLSIPDTIGKFNLILSSNNRLVLIPQLSFNFCIKSDEKFKYQLDLIHSSKI